jgi:DNA-binding CsgD family transcriptional regulator
MAPVVREGRSNLPSIGGGHGTGRTPPSCSPQRISELIGAIYDCVLDPGKWHDVLQTLNHQFAFAMAVLGVVPLRHGANVINVSVGYDKEWLAVADAYRAEIVDRWGGPERLAQYPLDEPIAASRAVGREAWSDNPYFRDVLAPRGLIDAVGIVIAREPSLVGYVAFSRHQSAGEVSASELDGLRLLGPHLRRAVTISNLFDMKTIAAASLASVLDTFSFGLVLVDAQLGIVHANNVATRMLAARDPIESRNGSLALRERACHAALERAVHWATLDEMDMGPRGIGIPARRAQGEPCVIHVLPLQRSEMRRGLAPRAVAALFIAPALLPPRMPSDALAVLYDLTPSETRIFELITDGQPIDTVADTLGVARTTVRSHLQHLFEKTGCKRQAELVKLASRLQSPV